MLLCLLGTNSYRKPQNHLQPFRWSFWQFSFHTVSVALLTNCEYANGNGKYSWQGWSSEWWGDKWRQHTSFEPPDGDPIDTPILRATTLPCCHRHHQLELTHLTSSSYHEEINPLEWCGHTAPGDSSVNDPPVVMQIFPGSAYKLVYTYPQNKSRKSQTNAKSTDNKYWKTLHSTHPTL